MPAAANPNPPEHWTLGPLGPLGPSGEAPVGTKRLLASQDPPRLPPAGRAVAADSNSNIGLAGFVLNNLYLIC